ncbi:S-layer homology domain-containing protein [Paenibacillus glycinis]|uniref:SLH domain-containing protein n=1 Tax=Paenibacillus glycinis TaxID=2697035 RepID=A0ABW9XWC4_9BACL|nr:S-layer homology domain-containing protein [Paenibacillus glycinis]NBD26733.1 hypothetical protein [Paenibacillus glycinis]
MRQTSKQYSKQNSQDPKQFRGGEKKVMKKSLSLLVAAAMTLTTASVAFADDAAPTTPTAPATPDLTAQQKFDALKELGIFNGYPDGSAGLDKQMTRAEFAKVLTKLTQLEENAAAAKVYKDVPATHWAAGFIGASTEAKLMNGLGANKFGPSGQVTVEQIAKVADLVAGIEPSTDAVTGKVSEWAKGYVAAAVKAGLLPELPSYQTNATRQLLVEVTYDLAADVVKVASTKIVDEKNIEVTFSDGGVVKKALDTALVNGVATKVTVEYQGKSYEVTVTLQAATVSKISQTGANKISVEYNQALNAAEQAAVKVEVKKDDVPYSVTTTLSEDKKSVNVTSNYLPAGEYSVSVNGAEAVKVTVADAVISKIEIGATALVIADNQKLGIKVLNQFGEQVQNPNLNVNVLDGTDATVGALDYTIVDGDYTVDLKTDKVEKDDVIIVSVLNPDTGISANKSFKATDGSAIVTMKIDTVKPLEGSTRITSGDEGVVIPYNFLDAAGTKYVLNSKATDTNTTDNIVQFDDVQFISSNNDIIDANSLAVDENGVLTFTAGNAGTAVITALNSKNGVSTSVTIKVEDATKVGKFTLQGPGALVAQGEDAAFNFVASDNYGGAIAKGDFAKASYNTQVTFTTNRGGTVTPKWNSKGELTLNFGVDDTKDGSTVIYAWVNNQIASQVTVDIKEKAVPTKVAGLKDLATLYGIGGSDVIDLNSVKVVDNWGRVMSSLPAGYALAVTEKAASDVTALDGLTVEGAAAGTSTLLIGLTNGGTAVAGSSYEQKVTVIGNDKVVNFAIDTIGTLYAKDTNTSAGDTGKYAKTVTVTGKTSDNKTVAIDQAAFVTSITSTDLSVVNVEGSKIFSNAKGTATIAAYQGATKLAELAVTTSDATPYAAKVAFDKTELLLGNGATDTSVKADLYVEDQYGVDVTALPAGSGVWASSDSSVAAVAQNGTITTSATKDGVATISYITKNGVVGTVSVKVQ